MFVKIWLNHMRYIIFFLLTVTMLDCQSQENKIVKYFDSLWRPVSFDSAQFRTEFFKKDSYYTCLSYRKKNGALYCKSSYRDTLFKQPLGILVRYYENGRIEDSIAFNDDATRKELFHYYENGKLWAHCTQQGKSEVCEGFDENGHSIDDFIFSKEAAFPGGNAEWVAYLSKALSKFNPGRKGAPLGSYRVMMKFAVDENGKLTDIKAETNFGYGMEDEGIEVLKKSPVWTPAIILNKKVKAYRLQPLTFIVEN